MAYDVIDAVIARISAQCPIFATVDEAWFAKPIDEFIDRPIIHRNTLFVNRGDNTYMETANYSGVAATEWTWGSTFMDVDLDGLEDLRPDRSHYCCSCCRRERLGATAQEPPFSLLLPASKGRST